MNKNKIRVCVYIDKTLNARFREKYPLMFSRYVEKCIQDALHDKMKVLDSVEKKEKLNIFNIGIRK